jgi:predicted alpha/beta superfamily hydrolase
MVGRLLLESPSLWASNRQLIRESRGATRWPERVYLAIGTAEAGRRDRDQSVVDDVRELSGIMRRANLGENRFRFVIAEGATHNESAWAQRFPEALRFLFGA